MGQWAVFWLGTIDPKCRALAYQVAMGCIPNCQRLWLRKYPNPWKCDVLNPLNGKKTTERRKI